MTILAHRGCQLHGPENRMAAFEAVANAAQSGVPLGVEFDVRCTADGQLVVEHDPSFEGHVLSISTYPELQNALRADCPPLYERVLEVVSSAAVVDVELKDDGYVERAVDLARVVPLDRLVISSFKPEVIAQVRQIAPEVTTGLLIDDEEQQWHMEPAAMLDALSAVDAHALIVHHSLLSEWLIDQLVTRDILVGTYTVNDHQRLRSLHERSEIDWICTDVAELVHQELHEL